MYKTIIRPFLFLLNPERAHHFTFASFKFILAIPGMKGVFRWLFDFHHPSLERTVFGITFKNPVGLAAGFDKDAQMIDEFASLGFGFIEIGTLTPLAQPGNDKPRLFRLPEDQSLINRMGFNNAGVEAAVNRLRKKSSNVVIGGNIGKNKLTPNEKAHQDYVKCYHALHQHVDYFVVNVSSPNTPGLRELQDKEPLKQLLQVVLNENKAATVSKPLLLKIAPDLNQDQLDDIIEIALELQLDGLIATNTTISRAGLQTNAITIEAIGAGGLSGRALRSRSTEVIYYLCQGLQGQVPVIAVGGIFTADDALEKLRAGASLVQVYTGLVYEGPGLIKRINQGLVNGSV